MYRRIIKIIIQNIGFVRFFLIYFRKWLPMNRLSVSVYPRHLRGHWGHPGTCVWYQASLTRPPEVPSHKFDLNSLQISLKIHGNQQKSSKTNGTQRKFIVLSLISLFFPPIIPASARLFFGSAITNV